MLPEIAADYRDWRASEYEPPTLNEVTDYDEPLSCYEQSDDGVFAARKWTEVKPR